MRDRGAHPLRLYLRSDRERPIGADTGGGRRLHAGRTGGNKMGENGRQAALEKYTWEKEARKLLKCYGITLT